MRTLPVSITTSTLAENEYGDLVPGGQSTTVATTGVLVRHQVNPRAESTDYREVAKLLIPADGPQPQPHSTLTVDGEPWRVEAIVRRDRSPFAGAHTAHVEVIVYREGAFYE